MDPNLKNHYVYIIFGKNIVNPTKTKYYIGYTNNPTRRIRQHNQEITGGAKATKGYKWKYVGLISNIIDNIEGLRIEWRLKHATKKRGISNKIESFLEYLEYNNGIHEIMNHILLMSIHPDLYELLTDRVKNYKWKNVIVTENSYENNQLI